MLVPSAQTPPATSAALVPTDYGLALSPQWGKVQEKFMPDPMGVSKRVFPLILMHLLWSIVVVAIHLKTRFQVRTPAMVHPLLVGVLALLLAFRTNQAFDRHWSSCKAWAETQKALHNFTRMASYVSQTDYDIYQSIMRHVIAYPIALKQRLRRQ